MLCPQRSPLPVGPRGGSVAGRRSGRQRVVSGRSIVAARRPPRHHPRHRRRRCRSAQAHRVRQFWPNQKRNVLRPKRHVDQQPQLFAYTGRPLDESTNLQNNHHRWYDAAIGQWASEDPIGFAASDANLLRYVGNTATIQTDPSGLADDKPILPTAGKWEGEPGNSRFNFKDDAIPSVVYRNNQPDFTDLIERIHFRHKGKAETKLAIVEIQMDCDLTKTEDARRATDRRAADAAMRKKLKKHGQNWDDLKTGDYVWHHQWVSARKGRGQMILIKKTVHDAAVHRGAFAIWTSILEARQSGDRGVLRKAHKLRRSLGRIANLAGKGAGALAVYCTYDAASRGWAAEGTWGAFVEVERELMFAEEIEDLVRPAGELMDAALDNASNNINRRRYGAVADDPAMKHWLNGGDINGGSFFDQDE